MTLLTGAAGLSSVSLVAREAPPEASPGPQVISPADALTLDEAIALAMKANRVLIAARLRSGIAQAGIQTARETPNPELTFEESKETPRDALTLAQPIETAGKRRKRIAVAEAETRTAEAEADIVGAEIRSRVRRTYAQLAAAQRRAAESEALASLAERTAGAARDRFESGAAPQLEALQAELAASQAENDSLAARAELSGVRAELNTLLARDPESALAASEGLDAGEVAPSETVVALSLAGNALIGAIDRRIEEALARGDLARANRYPDPVVSGGVTWRGEPEFHTGWRASLDVTLPLFTTHRGAVLAQDRTVAHLRAEREAAEAAVRGRVLAAAARAGALREQVVRYRDRMLPAAGEVERMAEDSYRSGQTSLVAMIQAIQSSREVRLKGVQAGLEFQLALDDLEQAAGVPLPRGSAP